MEGSPRWRCGRCRLQNSHCSSGEDQDLSTGISQKECVVPALSIVLSVVAQIVSVLMQTSTSGRVPVVKTFVSIWKQEQLRGLFAGNGANCLRVFPFSALVCLAYANLAKVSVTIRIRGILFLG